MTVSATQVRQGYTGTGITVDFAVPWYFLDDAALLVIRRRISDGVETLQNLGTDYTVTGAGNPAGGMVTMATAPGTGFELWIIHAPALLQPLDLTGGGAFPAQAFEEQLDRFEHQIQRATDLADRTPHLPDTDVDGAGAYDAGGNRLANLADPVNGQDAVTRSYALGAFATASGPAALPPDGSLGNAKWDPTSKLALTNVDDKSVNVATMRQKVDPWPGGVPSLATDADGEIARLRWQIFLLLEFVAGAGSHNFWYENNVVPVPTQISNAIAAAIIGNNELVNGSLLVSQRFPSESATGTIATGIDAYVCDECFIFPTGGTVTWARVSAGLHSAAVSPMGLEFTGAAGITNMRVGFRLGRRMVRKLGALKAAKNVTFGVKVRHSGSTGSITPNLLVRSTSNTGDDSVSTKFATANMTTRITQAFPGALAAGNEVAFTHTFDLGAMTDGQNGVEIYVDLLAMNAATVKFTVTDFWIAAGDISASLLPDDFEATLLRCLPGYQKTFNYATAPAQNAGFPGTLAMTGDDSLQCAFTWQHGVPLRFAPASPTFFVTYNPGAAAATPRNNAGDNGVLGTVSPGEKCSYIRFDSSGSKETDWHIHASADASFYD